MNNRCSIDRFRFLALIGACAASAAGQTDTKSDSTPAADVQPATDTAIDAALRLIAQFDRSAEVGAPAPLLADLEKIVDRAKTEAAGDRRLSYVVGRWYALSGRQGDAVTALRKYLDTREGRNDWHAHLALGDLFVDQFPHLALSSYDQANGLKSDEPGVLYGLARCAEKLGRMPDALTHARRLVDVAPTARYRSYLARLLFAQRQYEDAEREAQGALEQAAAAQLADPSRLSSALEIDGYYKLLLDMRQMRLAENPADADRYVAVAQLIGERAKQSQRTAMMEAVEVLRRGMENLKSDPPISLREALAIALDEAGRTDEARAEFEAIRKADPTHAVAAQWLARLMPGETPPPIP